MGGSSRLRASLPFVGAAALVAALVPAPGATAATAPRAALASSTSAYAVTAFTVRTDLAPERLPYALSRPLPVTGSGTLDRSGVRMLKLGGRLYDHPVAQAQYGLALLESYRLTQDSRYLALAEKQAGRLLARKVVDAGGWWFPYSFNYSPHDPHIVWRAPWYSGMAQGQSLSLFSRLAMVTGDAAYRQAADHVLVSLQQPYRPGHPWATHVVDGHLWIDEYPDKNTGLGDRTYNGHTFASFGLYDYYRLTGSPAALTLFRAAVTTTRDAYPQIRVPGWRSSYCLRHYYRDANGYHLTHIGLELELYRITGAVYFAGAADVLNTDYPQPATRAAMSFAPGTHTAYRIDSHNRVVARKTIPIGPRGSSAHIDARTRLRGFPGMWYHVVDGSLAGYYVQEKAGIRTMHGEHALLRWPDPRSGTSTHAITVAYRYAGGVLQRRAVSIPTGQRLAVDAHEVLDAVSMLRLSGGDATGWWVPSSSVRL